MITSIAVIAERRCVQREEESSCEALVVTSVKTSLYRRGGKEKLFWKTAADSVEKHFTATANCLIVFFSVLFHTVGEMEHGCLDQIAAKVV